jgi:hypothetical protein
VNGAWHFKESERLLVVATTQVTLGSVEQTSALAQAAIHAQLATAAALVDGRYGYKADTVDTRWDQVLNTRTLAGDHVPYSERSKEV